MKDVVLWSFMVRHTCNLTANLDEVVDQEFDGADHGTLSAAFIG